MLASPHGKTCDHSQEDAVFSHFLFREWQYRVYDIVTSPLERIQEIYVDRKGAPEVTGVHAPKPSPYFDCATTFHQKG